MSEIEVYYFPPEVPIPEEVLGEIIPLDYALTQQEYYHMWQHTNGLTQKLSTAPMPTPTEMDQNRKKYNQHWCIAMQVEGDTMKLAGFMYLTFGLGFSAYEGFKRVPNCVVVQSLVVHPEMRRKGVGTILLTYAYQFAKKMNIKNLALGVTSLNYNAVSLYEKFGFRILETNYFGIPKKESVSENFAPMVKHDDQTKAFREKMEKMYRDTVNRNSKNYYPLFSLTGDIVKHMLEFVWDHKYPVFMFGKDHGWCVIDQLKGEKVSSFYPLCITSQGLQHPAQVRKYIYYMSQVGKRLFDSPTLWFGVLDDALNRILSSTLKPYSTTRIKNVV